ncbi:MAG: metallophosphoesterase [Duncaniella sp.]|uniref:metallophosphoesterase n=1 Tax=Duncaniella sp. TaxID=2518496 RepID=UPI0023C0979C|nr:metallophosphoesterase [Duncaniella sp.]MDE5988364.1 metallophosphoesterase [Duncaniella sp.]
MRLPLVQLLIAIVVNILVDVYIYKVLKHRLRSRVPARIQVWTALALFVMIVAAICLPHTSSNSVLLAVMWMIYIYISVYFAKYVFVIIDLVARIPQLFKRKRLGWLSAVASVASAGVLAVFIWASLINRFHIDVNEAEIEISGLPAEFDGYRIAQISDLHVGTFGTDTAFVAALADRLNSLDADLIVFTGDIVNSRAAELLPHVRPLSRLSAPDGVLSILGNHDYGDYASWPDADAKRSNMELMKSLQKEMGWRLLLNESVTVRRGADSIAVIGVENIGDPPFPVYGSLSRAYPRLSDSVVKILLTHNPAHWVDSIASSPEINIPLSLAGHTHAMQFEVFGWSPAKYRYPTWGGLYADDDRSHQLYVNIGTGTVGFPARVGATPEITLFTLKKAKQLH